MKMRIQLGAALILFGCVFAFLSGAEPVIVVADTPSKLIFPTGGTSVYAAEFLRDFIQKATGKRLAVVPESEAGKYAERIWVGNTRFAAGELKGVSFQPEELLIRLSGGDLILCGEISSDGTDRGTLFAVYEFLERALGIRWFFADIPELYPDGLGTVIPAGGVLRLGGWDVRDHPRCRQREVGISYYYGTPEIQKRWHPVLRFGTSLPYGNANHTQVNWYRLYHESHPEYFARDAAGKIVFNTRLPHRNYLCPNSPGVLEQMIRNIGEADAGNPPEKAWGPCPPEKNYVYFAFNDGMTLPKTCHCPDCVKLLQPSAPEAGQASELVFDFVRRYADLIRKRWPERQLVTLAFHHYRKPPETVKIPKNVNVIYVTKRMHYANDPGVWNEETGYIRAWSRLFENDCGRLKIWLNIVQPMQYTSVVPLFYAHIFQKWLRANRLYSDAYFINGLNPYLKRLTEAARRKAVATYPMAYLQSRLLWNPDADPDAILADYTRALYGPAGEIMLKIYRIFGERWENFAMPSDADEFTYIHTVRYPAELVDEISQLFGQAAAATEAGSVYRARVEFFRDHQWTPFEHESKRGVQGGK